MHNMREVMTSFVFYAPRYVQHVVRKSKSWSMGSVTCREHAREGHARLGLNEASLEALSRVGLAEDGE
jgi:hypothetical protein